MEKNTQVAAKWLSPPKKTGSKCNVDLDCISQLCKSSICSEKSKIGQQCQSDNECITNTCSGGICKPNCTTNCGHCNWANNDSCSHSEKCGNDGCYTHCCAQKGLDCKGVC